jgi:hypothetical protein
MNLKTRLAKLEVLNNLTANKQVIYICFQGVCGDGSKPELLGYSHKSNGKETRIMRLADEPVDDFMRRCEGIVPIPTGAGAVIFMAIYTKT